MQKTENTRNLFDKKTSLKTVGAIAILSMGLGACGNKPPQFLKTVDLSVTQQNNDSFVNLTAEVNLGKASSQSITIPILDPKTGLSVGQVAFGPAADGNEQIAVSVDATTLGHADPTLGSTLPNGLPLPLGLVIPQGGLSALPILTDSRIYIGGDLKTNIVVGAALTIPQVDSVIKGIGIPGNLFFSQTFNANLFGLAGLYLSPDPNESGLAVFGEYTFPAGQGPKAPIADNGKVTLPEFQAHGKMPKEGNHVISENINSKELESMLKYFYFGNKQLIPH